MEIFLGFTRCANVWVAVATVVLDRLLSVMSEHPDPLSKPTVDRGNRRQYRIVAVSLYDTELAIADRLTAILKTAAWPTANRSFVIREALLRLNDDLAEREPEEVLTYFVARQARRLKRPPTP